MTDGLRLEGNSGPTAHAANPTFASEEMGPNETVTNPYARAQLIAGANSELLTTRRKRAI